MSQPQPASETSQPSNEEADTAPPPEEVLSEDQQELSRILRSWKLDPWGVISMGKDGVLRSLTAERDVIDAEGLRPGLIKAMLDRVPFREQQEDEFRGVDGSKAPREQWFHPDKSMLPPPLSDESRQATMKRMEERKKEQEERAARCEPEADLQNGGPAGARCRVVRSDHNLDPK